MSDRIELRVHDFLAEGRDESKSHVLLEIAQPAPNEVSTHGHFFALAELSNATPKTIQMVRAWIEFAIESYYKSTPTNIESHFETILNQLNLQSALYLKQHAHESINIAVASVCNSNLYIAIHGKPAALLFYHKDDTWRWMDLVDPNSTDVPGQLFSNVVNGSMRVDDRFLLATPRVIEFFSADRLAKISEGKSAEEVNEHMNRILNDMSSDYSFAGVWLRLVRAFDEVKEATTVQGHNASSNAAPPRRAESSMADLMKKTKSTAEILAPPVLTIPKDKIVTNLLKLAHKGMTTSGTAIVSVTRTSLNFIKANKGKLVPSSIPDHKSVSNLMKQTGSGLVSSYSGLPTKRKYTMLAAIAVGVITIGAVGSLAWMRANSTSQQEFKNQLESVREKLRTAEESFVYQNEPAARATLSEAAALFAALPEDIRTDDEGVVAAAELNEKRTKILRIAPVTLQLVSETESIKGLDIVSVGTSAVILSRDGEVIHLKENAKKIGALSNAQSLYFDESAKRIIAATTKRSLTAFPLDGSASKNISVSWMPEDTKTDASVFYSGRLYTYNGATKMIYRYDGSDSGYSTGKRWITDSGKPTGIVDLSADNSLWLRTDAGAVLKYTAGRLQAFQINGLMPDVGPVAKILTSASGKIYFLDTNNHRVVVTDRDGKLAKQYVFESDKKLTRFAIDKNETAVTGITDDGKVVKFQLAK